MHTALLAKLKSFEEGEVFQFGSSRQLKVAYVKMNLDYIALCEQNSAIHYMPSAKTDALMEKHQANDDLAKVRIVFQDRMQAILRCLQSV